MSQKPRWHDRLRRHLPSRPRSSQPSPSPASASSTGVAGTPQTASILLPGPSSTSGQVATVATPPPPELGKITLDRVLDELTDEQRKTIRGNSCQNATDLSNTLDDALVNAQHQKQLCVNRRWTLSIGSHAISSKEKADKVVALIDKFKAIGSAVAGADPIHAGLPWAGVCLILQFAVSEKHQMDVLMGGMATILTMKSVLDVYLDFYHKQPPGLHAQNLEVALVELHVIILRFLADAIPLFQLSQGARFFKALADNGELKDFALVCINAERKVEVAASNCDRNLDEASRLLTRECRDAMTQVLDDMTDLKAQMERIKLNTNFAKLPTATTASFDSIDEERLPRCLENTRIQVQEDIERWIQDSQGSTFFWLQGVAGTGKSTIARTVAQTLYDHGLLGASFFFKRSHAERGNADLFFASIATQLAKAMPDLGNKMAKVLEPEVGFYRKGISTQFNELLMAPLCNITPALQTPQQGLFILIDALDECDDGDNRKGDTKQLLQFLARLKELPHLRLRVIVTSRLEFPVELGFAQMAIEEHHDLVLHEIPSDHIEHDIQIFFQTQLRTIRIDLSLRRKREVLGEGWPGDAVIRKLTDRSKPLFIFASTVCMFIADNKFAPQEQLQKVLDNREPMHLDSTYRLVLETLVPESDSALAGRTQILSDFRGIVGLIIFSTEPPSIATIAALLDFSLQRVETILDSLHSVLDVTTDLNRPVRPFHLSFIEYLARPKVGHDFKIDERQTHAFIADRCLDFMMQPNRLHEDMCQLHDPGAKRFDIPRERVSSTITPAVAYACKYWVHHLVKSGQILDEHHKLSDFLLRYFIFWFEAMAWLGNAYDVQRIINELQDNAKTNNTGALNAFLADAYSFTRAFHYIVDIAPLQIYASALVFAPEESVVKARFNYCAPKWLIRSPKVEKTWNKDVYTLEGHTGPIVAIEFSPNDHFLATCSWDETVRVWDTTAVALFCSFQKRGYAPTAAAFSNDNTRIAIAYWASNGVKKRPRIVTVVVYEIASGKVFRELEPITIDSGARNTGWALAFSDDMSIVLGASVIDTIRAWRAADDESTVFEALWVYELPTLGRSRIVPSSITICRVAPRLAYYHENGVIGSRSLAVFDLLTGSVVSSQHGENISGDIRYHGKDLAMINSMGPNDILGLLNVRTGDFENLPGYNGPSALKFALAHNKDKVAVSYDSVPQIVEVQSLLAPQEERKTQQEEVRSIVVSASGEAIAVRYLYSLGVFSPEGRIVAQRSRSSLIAPFLRSPIGISPDGSLIADLDDDGNLWIMDINTSSEGQVNISRSPEFEEIAFSRDNKQITTQSYDGVSVWDLEFDQEGSSILVSPRNDRDDLSSAHCPHKITSGILSPKDHALHSELENGVGFEQRSSKRDELEWIQYNKKDILWIPKRYRAKGCACGAGGKVAAMVHGDGSVTTMKFADHITL